MLNLIVLYVSDLDASLGFYSLLGFQFVEEQHGAGWPVHHAATLPGGLTIELYPAHGTPPSRVRLGVTVPDPAGVAEELRGAGFTVKRSDLALDPDGSRVMITAR